MATIAELRKALRAASTRFVEEVIRIAAAHATAFTPPPPRADGAPATRTRRRVDSLHTIGDEIVTALSTRGGVAVSEIARAIGKTPSEIARPITILLAAGRITKEGERRGTKYFVAGRTRPSPRATKRSARAKPGKRDRRR